MVLAQKIVSKAEGRYVVLSDIEPSSRALQLAKLTRKDARLRSAPSKLLKGTWP